MRKVKFVNGEYYHILNRGVDKRDIFLDKTDLGRFFQSMREFNTLDPIGSIYEAQIRKKNNFGNQVSKDFRDDSKVVNFICYCINPNHYHFILRQLVDRGIEKFMQRLALGYSKYFNLKYKRSGTLFQGPYKAILIDSDDYLLHLSSYINLNNKVHGLENTLYKSSWGEYSQNTKGEMDFCEKDIILNQFSSQEEYKSFAEESLKSIRERKELEKLLLD
jgi:REP element-mobilizing transposase RayT